MYSWTQMKQTQQIHSLTWQRYLIDYKRLSLIYKVLTTTPPTSLHQSCSIHLFTK